MPLNQKLVDYHRFCKKVDRLSLVDSVIVFTAARQVVFALEIKRGIRQVLVVASELPPP